MKYPTTTPFNPFDENYQFRVVHTPWIGNVIVNGDEEKEALEAFVAQECRKAIYVTLITMFVIVPLLLIYLNMKT